MKLLIAPILVLIFISSCTNNQEKKITNTQSRSYFDYSNSEDQITGGIKSYSEFGITGNASLKGWDVSARLGELKIPTLMIGGKYDAMDPKYMEWMSTQVQKGRSVTTNGSHIFQYDDAEGYFSGLIKFIKDVNQGDF